MESVHLKDKENYPSLRPRWLFSMDTLRKNNKNRREKHQVPPVPKAEKEPNQKKPTGSIPPT